MSRLWTPADLAVAPRIWVDGDQAVFSGSNLTSIANTGSQGGSFTKGGTPTKTTLNGLNGVQFNASGQVLTQTIAAWGAGGVLDTFAVITVLTNSVNRGLMHMGGVAPSGVITMHPTGDFVGGDGGGFIAGNGYGSGPKFSMTNNTVTTASAAIVRYLLSTALSYYLNGTDTSSEFDGTEIAGAFPSYASQTWTWGEDFAGGSENLQGSIYQCLNFDYALNTTNRQLLEGWSAWKYGLQGNLPVGHPYKSAPPTVPTTTPISCQATSTPPALLTRATSKVLLVSSTSLAALRRATSKPILRTTTPPGLLKRSTSKALRASSTSTAKLTHPVTKILQASSTSVASLRRTVTKLLLGSSTSLASLVPVAVRLVAALASSTSLALLKRAMTRTVQVSSTSVASLRRTTGKALLASSTSIASCLAASGRFVTALASSTSVASLRRAMSRDLTVSSAAVASLRRLTSKAFRSSSTSVASLLRGLSVAIFARVSSVSVATLDRLSSFSITIMASSTSIASVALSVIPAVGQLVRRLTGRWSSAQLSGQQSSGNLDGGLQ